MSRFAAVIANTWAIVFRSLKFQGFNLVVSQIAVVFPLIIQAPRYFARQISLGDVTQTATAFGNVQGALSFFRFAYDDFAGYRAVLNRLTGLLDSNDEARELPGPAMAPKASGLGIHNLNVTLPDGRPLLSNLNLDLTGGASLLVKGPSGTGKTTLLRSMAGLWPHVSGTIGVSVEGGTMFCSQQPYLPLGTLRTALAYPMPAAGLDDATAQAVLQAVLLGHLVGRLGEEADWAKTLSPGEQQRLSFGRILLARPALAFLDESTSALDEGMEYAMYSLIRQWLPGITIVSVGHRATLDPLHTNELRLVGAVAVPRQQVPTVAGVDQPMRLDPAGLVLAGMAGVVEAQLLGVPAGGGEGDQDVGIHRGPAARRRHSGLPQRIQPRAQPGREGLLQLGDRPQRGLLDPGDRAGRCGAQPQPDGHGLLVVEQQRRHRRPGPQPVATGDAGT